MANGFGYCEDCEYWDAGAEGDVKPCRRINRDGVDVAMDGAEIPPEEQTFSTTARFGCSLFEPVAGMEAEEAGPGEEVSSGAEETQNMGGDEVPAFRNPSDFLTNY